MHGVLQDRLVKELRLRQISTLDAANAYALAFVAEFNARFAKVPRSDFDAHRPVRADEDLTRIFTWREWRKVPQSLTLQYDKVVYLLENVPQHLQLIGRTIEVAEYPDGRIELWADGAGLPYSVFESARDDPAGRYRGAQAAGVRPGRRPLCNSKRSGRYPNMNLYALVDGALDHQERAEPLGDMSWALFQRRRRAAGTRGTVVDRTLVKPMIVSWVAWLSSCILSDWGACGLRMRCDPGGRHRVSRWALTRWKHWAASERWSCTLRRPSCRQHAPSVDHC